MYKGTNNNKKVILNIFCGRIKNIDANKKIWGIKHLLQELQNATNRQKILDLLY